jgi:class 3 adenylate cyclase/predicted ATPase
MHAHCSIAYAKLSNRRGGGQAVTFDEILERVLEMLRRRGRVSYRALKVQFQLDDTLLEILKDEIVEVHQLARDQEGEMLVWTGDTASPAVPTAAPAPDQSKAPLTYTPPYLAEKILTSRPALEGERKQVTVLFADIKDSTELIQDLDPEAAQQLLDPALHRMMEAVHRFEGTVNQVLGDGIMALFGAPIAHEDHALRACYAALTMQTAMREYTEAVRRTHGIELRIRVGINAGEVVVRAIGNDLHMDYSAVGQTTHLAARMEQLAAPGTIRLTAGTLRLIEGLVQVHPLGPIPVKGMTEPVEVFELVGASALRRRRQAAAARGLTRFVGREVEVAALRQALAQAGTGHGQVVAVVGEAGVGKSRLVYECVHAHHTQGWRVLESASVSYGKATPYFPVVDLLKRYVHVEDADEPRTVRAKVTGQVLTLDETLQETVPALLWLLDALPDDSPFRTLEPPQRRQRTLEALKRVLLRESQVQPLLLVFEDLHWIDAETQVLLDRLVESLPTARLLLLVNYRPEYQHAWGSKTYYTQVRLDPLPPASAEAVLHNLLGDDPSLVPLKQLLIARTEGNPFFLEESVRTLVETGVLVGERGTYRLAKALPTIQVPATVQAVLAARIDRLPPDAKRLLQTAAVIGSEIPLSVLQAVAALSETALHAPLAQLQAAEFLYETRLFPDQVYTFKHALTQQVAYQSLLTSTRQQVHRQVAQVFESRFAETATTQPELLAHHYTEAGCPEPAVAYWQKAGQHAVERSAHPEAITHLSKALEVLKTLPDTPTHRQQELDLQLALGPALVVTRGPASLAVEQAYTRARELCQQVGETPQLFPVLWGLWRFYSAHGEHQRARALGEQLLTLAQRVHDAALLLEAHHVLWATLFWSGEFAAARAHLEQGRALYDPQQHRSDALLYGGHDPGVCCLNHAACCLWILGYPDQALQSVREALTLAHALAHPPSLANALSFATMLYQSRREPQAVHERAEACVVLADEQGFADWLAQATIMQGWALAAQGQATEGTAQMRQGLAAWAAGSERQRPYHLALLAEAYGRIGQPAEGLSLLTEALASVDRTGARVWEAELHRLEGELLLTQAGESQQVPEAEACFRQALDVARRQLAKSWELRAAMSLSRLWQQQAKRAEARELLAPIYSWFTEGFDTPDLQEAKALLDELA